MMTYDSENIFAKILSGTIPCREIYRDDHVLAFYDINPKAAIHALVIPKGAYVNASHFHTSASVEELVGFYRGVEKVVGLLNISPEKGYRILSNCGPHGGQEVPHYHVHIFAGQPLGPMLCQPHA